MLFRSGEPREGFAHEHHIWHVDRVRALVASQDEAVTFFCGGSRNFAKFIDLFDGVFVLKVDPSMKPGRVKGIPVVIVSPSIRVSAQQPSSRYRISIFLLLCALNP